MRGLRSKLEQQAQQDPSGIYSEQFPSPGPSSQFTESQIRNYRADTPKSHHTPQVEFEYSDEERGMKVRSPKRPPSPPPPQRLLAIPGESEAEDKQEQGDDDDPMGEQDRE